MLIFPVEHLPPVIPVGVQTSKGVREIGFDVSAWLNRWPDMTLSVWHTRPGEREAYPAVSDMDGNILLWNVSGYDTELTGKGKVEILGYTQDGKRNLTGAGVETIIKGTTLATTKDPGEAASPWVDEVVEAAEEAKRQADRAEQIANDMSGGVITGAVRYDAEQNLTEEQKTTARKNIGADTGVNFTTDKTLTLDPRTKVLSVNTADDVEQDNTLPVTSAAVYAEIGNINALLETI